MKRKMWVVFVISAILVFSGWLVAAQLQKQATLAENRHHIFCEKLVKGMNKHEVLTVLRESGEFEYGTADWGEYSEIVGNFTDRSIIGQATVHVMFASGKYTNAYMERFSERGEVICSLP